MRSDVSSEKVLYMYELKLQEATLLDYIILHYTTRQDGLGLTG